MHFPGIMAPNHHFMLNSLPLEPVSRTYQYRKIMKPMLERKRRARINKCLDELKDLMTGTLQADGENVSKLEKADILELTVRHLHRLRENNSLFLHTNDTLNMEKFWAGFQHCATEVTQFLHKYDRSINSDLIKHIASYIPNMAAAAAAATVTVTTTATNTANYQRFTTAVAAAAAAATVIASPPPPPPPTVGNQMHKTTVAATKLRSHPYARTTTTTTKKVDAVADGDDEGGMWRPW